MWCQNLSRFDHSDPIPSSLGYLSSIMIFLLKRLRHLLLALTYLWRIILKNIRWVTRFLFLFICFTSSIFVSVKLIFFGGWIKLKMFLHLLQRLMQGVLRDTININRIFVKIKLIPILLPYIFVFIAQC